VRRTQRLERLEVAAQDVLLERDAERLAREVGIPVDEALRDLRETRARIVRFGWDAELRRLAEELGQSEEETRAQIEEAMTALREEFEACD